MKGEIYDFFQELTRINPLLKPLLIFSWSFFFLLGNYIPIKDIFQAILKKWEKK